MAAFGIPAHLSISSSKSPLLCTVSTVKARSRWKSPAFNRPCRPTCTVASPSSSQSCAPCVPPSSVVEVWSNAKLCFAFVSEVYAKGILATVTRISDGSVLSTADVKVSFDEIISVWPCSLQIESAASLADCVRRSVGFLKKAPPRSVDLRNVHTQLANGSKESRKPQSSFDLAPLVFPQSFVGPETPHSVNSSKRIIATIAAAILLSSDTSRFKRAAPLRGWRPLQPSVVAARQRTSFVSICADVLNMSSLSQQSTPPTWTREQIDILRDIQIIAASGSIAKGTAATALRQLGYESSDKGAAQFLLDIHVWGTGLELPVTVTNNDNPPLPWDPPSSGAEKKNIKSTEGHRGNPDTRGTARDWAFPPEILVEARQLRKEARIARENLSTYCGGVDADKRYNFHSPRGSIVRVYCVDDKNTRFLDDAVSVQVVSSNIVRVLIHVADVDDVVRSGSPVDNLARERGFSLYLPLKPLHMLPAAVMEAASFSMTKPTKAVTISIDVDLVTESFSNWQVMASIVPPVQRISYELFDNALRSGCASDSLNAEQVTELGLLAQASSILKGNFDRRGARTKVVSQGPSSSLNCFKAKNVASVRLVKRQGKHPEGASRVAHVIDFRSTPAHIVIDSILTASGALVRQFAKENNVFLPEGQNAASYVSRCGTAPMRRYADLAVQRQIKCILFGRQPSGKRRMAELRVWLSKRHADGERILNEKRRIALFASLSNHCAQSCLATGADHATLVGQVRGVNTTRKGVIRVDVSLDGTGLSTTASVSSKLQKKILEMSAKEDGRIQKNDVLQVAKSLFPTRSKMNVKILKVDTIAFAIKAEVTGMASEDF